MKQTFSITFRINILIVSTEICARIKQRNLQRINDKLGIHPEDDVTHTQGCKVEQQRKNSLQETVTFEMSPLESRDMI